MRLVYSVPRSLQTQLEVNSKKLVKMSLDFNRVAAELKLFTFYETIDTELTPSGLRGDVITFTAPIVSIRSAVLEIHHEVERPLIGNHADCAAFGSENDYAQLSYLEKLQRAVNDSLKLWEKFLSRDHIELKLKEDVEIEVHGFYGAGEKLGLLDKLPIRLWSTKDRLKQFLLKGPAKCLQDYLQENTQDAETVVGDDTITIDSPSSDSLNTQPLSLSPTRVADATQDRRNHSDRTASPLRRRISAVQLTRPNVKNQKLAWVHLPFNNPTWCSVSNFLFHQCSEH